MAQEEKMRFYDPPIRSMKQAAADIRGDKKDQTMKTYARRNIDVSRRIASEQAEAAQRGDTDATAHAYEKVRRLYSRSPSGSRLRGRHGRR